MLHRIGIPEGFGLVPILIGATAASLLAGNALAERLAVDLYVRPGTLATVDGTVLPTLCYAEQETGDAELPPPAFRLEAGDTWEVTLHNQDDTAHGIEVVGIGGSSSSVAPGSSELFVFDFPSSGTFLYRDPVAYPVNQGVGLAGIVEIADPGATHDADFTWLLMDHSEEWMNGVESGLSIDTAVYIPNYFTVNGLSGADTSGDPRAHITGRVGDQLLIRVANGGLRIHTLHFHGYHVDVMSRNGAELADPISKDTVPIPSGETAELMLTPHQGGIFPIHDHVVLSVAANGVYPLGMIVFTDIQE